MPTWPCKVKKLGLLKEFTARCRDVSIVDMAGSSLNVGKNRFPTITATRGKALPYFVPALGRMSDLFELCRAQGSLARL